MQTLVDKTVEDIKACANACDTYAKKKLAVKVLRSSNWDDTFKGFIKTFSQRRHDFTYALSIHVGVAVDDAKRELKKIDEKMDLVIEFLMKHAMSAEQQEVAAWVGTRGGASAVMGSNEKLQELVKVSASFSGGAGKHDREGGSAESVRHGETNDFGTIKQELYESAERAIQDNLDTFERKYKMQQRELAAELSRVMEHTGDRIIKAVTSGPHDRIKDPVSRFSDSCRNRADYARSIFMRYGRTW